MAMKALRDASNAGLGKFILFGFLALAVAGLALTDVGGFFSGGTGSNNVLKVAGQKVSIQEFDRKVRTQLQNIGLSAQDAYKMGYLNQILAGEIRSILLQKQASDSGIAPSRADVANYINEILKPLVKDGETTQSVLKQILFNQRISESQFEQVMKEEIAARLLTDSLTKAASANSEAVLDGLYQFQKETRDIAYIKFLNSEIKVPTPSSDDLQAHYDRTKESYKTQENRSVDILLLDEAKITQDTSLDAGAILDKKFELVEQLEDLAASGLSAEEIAKQIPVIVTSIPALTKDGQQLISAAKLSEIIGKNIAALAKEAFATDAGETSMAIELPGAKFAAIKVNEITEEAYKPLYTVKAQVTKAWQKDQQAAQTKSRAQEAFEKLTKEGATLDKFAKGNGRTLRRLKALARGTAQEPLTNIASQTLFNAKLGQAELLPIEGGQIIAVVTKANLPEVTQAAKQSQDYKALKDALAKSAGSDALQAKLEATHKKSPAKVNDRLLQRVYGESDQ